MNDIHHFSDVDIITSVSMKNYIPKIAHRGWSFCILEEQLFDKTEILEWQERVNMQKCCIKECEGIYIWFSY